MVAPLVAAPAAAAIAGGGAAALGSLAGGGSGDTINKKTNIDQDRQVTRNTTTNRTISNQETINPQIDSSINYNPQLQISSPKGSIGSTQKLTSKKAAKTSQSNPVTLPVRQDPRQRSGQVGGGNQSGGGLGGDKLALVGIAGVAAYFLTRG